MKYRLPAEWEPQAAVQLTFPHEDTDWASVLDEVMPCFVEIAETISRFQPVIVVCRNADAVRRLLKNVRPEHLILAEADSNDTWARDHGGITMLPAGTEGKRKSPALILDFVFNGWGLKFPADKDNLLTGHLHRQGVLKGRLRHGGMVLEGGGIETDGEGTLLTTSECMLSPNRNPHLTARQIEKRLIRLFGAKRVLWLHNGYLSGDDTDSHVDTLARFGDVHTILYMRCTDTADEHFPALQAMETELQLFRTPHGRPYRLVALPWPDACYDASGHRLPATYANFLFINGAVLVPLYGVRQDAEAMQIFREVFPDREVIGINCRPLILQHGSLHCVTMQYPAF